MRVQDARRIAVLRANAIGDFLMAVPALEALRHTYPDAEITVIGDKWLSQFLRDRPGPWTSAVVAPPYPGLRGLPVDTVPGAEQHAFFEEHRGRYDVVLQMHGGGASSNRFVRLLDARITAGPRIPDADPLDREIPYIKNRHEVLRWLEVAELVGATGPSGTSHLIPRVTVTERDVAESRAVWPVEEPFAVLHAGAKDERRRWLPQKFAEVVTHLRRRHDLATVLSGGPADETPSREVAQSVGGCVADVTSRLTLGGTLGLVARSRIFIGNDSGPRHLAVAAGIPTVGVFWIENLLTFGPLAGAAARAAVSFRIQCPVCGRTQVTQRCEHDVSFVDDVGADEVGRLADEVLTLS